MKIAILSAKFPPQDIGGTEIAAYNIAKDLSKTDEVHVITRKQKNKAEGKFSLHFVNYISNPYPLRILSTSIAFFLKLRKIKPDVIYAETVFAGGLGGVLAKKILGIPVIVRPVGELYTASWITRKTLIKFVLTNSTLVLAMTKHMEKEARSYGKIETAVLPDGVDYEYFKNYPKQKRVRNSVLYVGRLIETKGVKDLIKALSEVIKSIPGAKLFIAGYGNQEEELKKLTIALNLTKNIIFLGKVEKSDVAKYMKSSEIFVLPSYSEGFPLVLAEALACGLPVITTKVKGLPEIIKDKINGYLIEPGDYKDLAEKIIFLFKNDPERTKISRKNIEESEKYAWENVTHELLVIFKRF